jgi:hypothetical protein
MRKLIAFTLLCFSSLLLKNEKGSCEVNCQLSCAKKTKSVLKTEANTDSEAIGMKRFDGFFFKI